MKKKKFEHMVAWALTGVGIIALLPWLLFKPISILSVLDDTFRVSEATENYGEDCSVFVRESYSDSSNPPQDILDVQSLVDALSVRVTSHIRKKDNNVYRLVRQASPFGAKEAEAQLPSIILETIYNKGTQYARYDTAGPWISFPAIVLDDMGEYIQQMFKDQFYYSLNDIDKGSIRLHEIQTSSNGKKVYIFRGEQTRDSLNAARQFFQYPIGSYEVGEHYGEMIVDFDTRSVQKTTLYARFDYSSGDDREIKLHFPLYQECVPVSKKDLEVHPPSNAVQADAEQIRQYLLFKVLPKP